MSQKEMHGSGSNSRARENEIAAGIQGGKMCATVGGRWQKQTTQDTREKHALMVTRVLSGDECVSSQVERKRWVFDER